MIKKVLVLFCVLFLSGLVILARPSVTAAYDPLATQCAKAPTSPVCVNRDKNSDPVVTVIGNAASLIAVITGVAAVIMIVMSGFTMITSGGNPEAVSSARRRLLYAIVGLLVAALAWTIARFITDKLL